MRFLGALIAIATIAADASAKCPSARDAFAQGETYARQEEWTKAAAAFANATRLAPKNARYAARRGHLLMELASRGQASWSEARAPLEAAVAIDPNLAEAQFDLAEVLLRLGDEQGALDRYTRAIAARPDVLARYAPLVDSYARLDRLAEAEKVANAGLSFDRAHDPPVDLRIAYGDVLERKGDVLGAVAQYEAAKKACGSCAERGESLVHYRLGVAYASLNPPRKSEAYQMLLSFTKRICKGALASRYVDECTTTQDVMTRLAGTP